MNSASIRLFGQKPQLHKKARLTRGSCAKPLAGEGGSESPRQEWVRGAARRFIRTCRIGRRRCLLPQGRAAPVNIHCAGLKSKWKTGLARVFFSRVYGILIAQG
jgi:hypothetical protein